MLVRALAATALAAAGLATPAAAAGTDGPYCAFHPVCDKIAAIVDGSVAVRSHTICHRIEEQAPWLVYCHD